MVTFLSKWLKIYEDEIGLFIWSMILLFLIRSSGIIFNNFAETAFLKRYGVEYLPIVYMLNSIATFIIMGVMAGIMARLPGARLLSYLLVFCGASVGGLRFLIPFGFDLIYPLLFLLKAQYEILLGLLFWNLANDLFNTRQSKRLFPLITAGGVLGDIIGSVSTPTIARIISLDNLMLIYLGTTMLGALTVKGLGSRFPTILLADKGIITAKKGKPRAGIIEEIKKIIPLMKESTLVKILILLTFLPNVIVPIMNYQFNFAVNEQFATEGGMIAFFGYFRGFMNVISLFLLMFVGRAYGRLGLPVVLMFHPFNYILAFLAFLLRFDIFSAMYARMSTNVLRTTFNKPATAVLMGLFPESYRAVMRAFLRGTVVRIGLLMSSCMILISEKFFHPKFLSLVALPFVALWFATPFFLKRNYSKILLDLISKNMLDLKSMEEHDVRQLFMEKKIRRQLVQSFQDSRGENSLWYARLLKSISLEDLDTHILTAIKDQDDKTQIGLLNLLTHQAGEETVQVLRQLVHTEKKLELSVAVVQAVNRLSPEHRSHFNREIFETTNYLEVKAHAIAGLFDQDSQKYKTIIDAWLDADDINERKAGIIAAGESGEASYGPRLKSMLDADANGAILPFVLRAIHRLGPPDLNDMARPHLSHSVSSVRLAALEMVEINDDQTLKDVIALMADPSEQVHVLAKFKIETAPYQNGKLLVESLSLPRRRVREGIFDLLETLNIKDLGAYLFARSKIELSYHYLSEEETLKRLQKNTIRHLLIDHLHQKKRLQLENILRVLAIQDRSGQMRIICRGIFSSDNRQRANSQEALDDLMDTALSKILIPLLDDTPPSQALAIGRKNFQIPDFSTDEYALYAHLLDQDDWVTVALTLLMMQKEDLQRIDRTTLQDLTKSENLYIRQTAQRMLDQQNGRSDNKEDDMESEISIADKILQLKEIDIFNGLSVSELAAIASVMEDVVYEPGKIVIKEGDIGETMYLVFKGEVSVIKGHGQDHEMELDRIVGGDYFGEMALFEDTVRSATIRTEQESSLIVLHKQELKEIVREYPQIALEVCKVLSSRIRKLHQKVTAREKPQTLT